jgi:hypothetical protein
LTWKMFRWILSFSSPFSVLLTLPKREVLSIPPSFRPYHVSNDLWRSNEEWQTVRVEDWWPGKFLARWMLAASFWALDLSQCKVPSMMLSITFPAVSGIVECMNFNHGFSHHSCLFHVYLCWNDGSWPANARRI